MIPVVYLRIRKSQLDAQDTYFDMYKRAREMMELSGMKMLPEQEAQAGGLHLWQLIRQAQYSWYAAKSWRRFSYVIFHVILIKI